MNYTNVVFAEMRDKMNEHFKNNMQQHYLVRIDCNTDNLWELYLDSFPDEIQKPWRERAFHDCQACKKWFKNLSNVVALTDEGEIITFFSCKVPDEYQMVFKILESFIIDAYNIRDIYLSSHKQIGHIQDLEHDETTGKVLKHDHFYTILPDKVLRTGVKVGQDIATARTNRYVFEGSLGVISLDAINTVLELIEDNNLYRGQEWKKNLTTFRDLKEEFAIIAKEDKNNWYWLQSLKYGQSVSRIKNHSIGVLLTDLSNGVDLEDALKRYETVVAPSNYKRPKAIFTKKMLEDARKKINELGYLDSIERRYATLEDVSINNTLFANRSLTKGIKDGDIFDELERDVVVKHKTFDYAIEKDLKDFIKEDLPNVSEVALYTDYSLANNFVSLVTSVNDAPSMFKWNNSFSWAYKNNIADSMKEQVKAMGGNVDVDLRFSIRWNNRDEWDKNDLDAHCVEPDNTEIYFGHEQSSKTGGWLDVDIIDPQKNVPAVENIQYSNKSKMIPGTYYFFVHQFSYRGGDLGFQAEIEFDGKLYRFDYPYKLKQDERVPVAKVILEDGNFSIEPALKDVQDNISIWNVKMNEFVPVSLICYSPNYWDTNEVGNQHIFFMLNGCINDERPNAWFNEYLNNELNDNRKVMEALASKAKLAKSDNQLSGLGFSMTRHNTITVKIVNDEGEKIYKLKI